MDRKKYLAALYSAEDRKIISIFHEAMRDIRLAYLQAVNAWDITKANKLMKRISDIAKKLEKEYWVRATTRLEKEYLKWVKYIDDVSIWGDSISVILTANSDKIHEMISDLWPVHMEAVKALLNSSKMYVKASLDWMTRVAINSLQKVQQEKVREQLAKSTITWDSLTTMKSKISKLLADEKITSFQDRAWRYWSMDRYIDMLTRTETSIANAQGTINRAIQLWIFKFKVVEQADCCKKCAEYNGKIVDVRVWLPELPPFHPNCRWYIIAVLDDLRDVIID